MDWHGFELHPETPPGGLPVTELFPQLDLRSMQSDLSRFAEGFGVGTIRLSGHVPNTRRALAVTELAREQGKLHPFREATMNAFWRDGLDIEADGTLERLAVAVGLDAHAAREAADAPRYLRKVDEARRLAHERGVHAIPTFFLGQLPTPIVGCQPYERLAAAAAKAGAARRAPGTSSSAGF